MISLYGKGFDVSKICDEELINIDVASQWANGLYYWQDHIEFLRFLAWCDKTI